ncbi:MAG TPA: hypothetical protein VJY66_03215 [Acholeplasma sp.]|nr:hypothetical protein [Acholeplasma sp.]
MKFKKFLSVLLAFTAVFTIVACEAKEDPVVEDKFTVTLQGEGLTASAVKDIKKDTEVTLTIVVPSGKVFEKLVVDGKEVTVTENKYKFAVTKNVTAVVSYTDEVVEDNGGTVVAKYEGITTKFSETETDNNAALIGLDPEMFTVLGNVLDGGSYTNPIGLNKAGSIRLYSNRETGEGNVLTISIKDGYKISKIEFTFLPNEKDREKEPDKAELKLDEVAQELSKAQLVSTVSFADLVISSFSLKNNNMGTVSTQIWIASISITYVKA